MSQLTNADRVKNLMAPADTQHYTEKDNPDYREREIMRFQDYPANVIELMQKHKYKFNPNVQYQMMLSLLFAQSEAVLFGNLSVAETILLDSEVSALMSIEKLTTPRAITEMSEYWDTREWQKIYMKIKHTRPRYGAEMYHSTVRREQLTIDDKRNASLLDQVGEATKDGPTGGLSDRIRSIGSGLRR